jgi:hypothetical protein
MAPNTDKVYSAYAANPIVDGEIVRIARDGSSIWTITFDPGGAKDEDITPPGTNISEDVLLWLYLMSETSSTSPVIGAPSPGFDDVAVSGAGSIGRFDSGVDHTFHWDHVADLGSGVVAVPEVYCDTEA